MRIEPGLDSLDAKKNTFREPSIGGAEVDNQSHHDEKGAEDQAPRGQDDGLNMPFAFPNEMQDREP